MYQHHCYIEMTKSSFFVTQKNNAKVSGNADHVSVSTYCKTMRPEMMAGKGKAGYCQVSSRWTAKIVHIINPKAKTCYLILVQQISF